MDQRGPPPQGRREGHQPRVAECVVLQRKHPETRHNASVQCGGERRGAGVAHMQTGKTQLGHGRQCARAQPVSQPLHAVGAGCAVGFDEAQLLERWQHRA
eukprot:scaffold64733_cov62-Phaeocystis_antarctica.AAC.8